MVVRRFGCQLGCQTPVARQLQKLRVEGPFPLLDRAQLEVGARTFELGVCLLGEAKLLGDVRLTEMLLRPNQPHPNGHQVDAHEGDMRSSRWRGDEIIETVLTVASA